MLVVEGEKSVTALTALGLVATCPPSGASLWTEAYSEDLWRAGANVVVVLPDNDQPGREHAKRVVQACHGFRPTFTEFSCQPEEPWSTWPCAEPEDDEVQPLTEPSYSSLKTSHTGGTCATGLTQATLPQSYRCSSRQRPISMRSRKRSGTESADSIESDNVVIANDIGRVRYESSRLSRSEGPHVPRSEIPDLS